MFQNFEKIHPVLDVCFSPLTANRPTIDRFHQLWGEEVYRVYFLWKLITTCCLTCEHFLNFHLKKYTLEIGNTSSGSWLPLAALACEHFLNLHLKFAPNIIPRQVMCGVPHTLRHSSCHIDANMIITIIILITIIKLDRVKLRC